MSNCLFCKIVKHEIPTKIISENDRCLAFRDINPTAPTHILIIPKAHIGSTREFTPENVSILFDMALLANEISESEGLTSKGYRWVINTGEEGGQTVFHLHMHLLGGRKMTWPPG